jgi:hypothetical protein
MPGDELKFRDQSFVYVEKDPESSGNSNFPATQVIMSQDQYRIAVVLGLTAAGATQEEAQIEADRRLAVMA